MQFMTTIHARTGALVAAALLLQLANGHTADGEPKYKTTGLNYILRLGSELYKALKPKQKEMVHSQPIFLVTEMMPYIKCVEYPGDGKPMRAAWISSGFIDLMNNVAHAKAIDKIQKGYFEKYVLSLAKESGENELSELPDINNKKFWSEDVMNEQISYFNQMVTLVVAIEISHHYLGHFAKYREKVDENQANPVPINSLLTPAEWDASLRAAVASSMNAGMGVDGLKALYEAFNKMPQRPKWTVYFLPPSEKADKARKALEKYESAVLNGKEP